MMNLQNFSSEKLDTHLSSNHNKVMKVAKLWGTNIALLESKHFFAATLHHSIH